MQNKEENLYSYLSYVTLREMWAETKSYFLAWLIFSVVSLAVGAFVDFGVSATKDIIEASGAPILPKWGWFAIIFLAISWFMRGEEIRFKFPEMTFQALLILALIVGVITFVLDKFPFWIGFPFYWAVVIGLILLDALAAKGKENYLKLTGDNEEDA